MNRRNFLKNTAISSVGLTIGSEFLLTGNAYSSIGDNYNPGIRGITPVALMEDTQLLLLRVPGEKINIVKKAIVSDLHTRPAAPGNKARLAALLPANDKRILKLFESLKTSPDQRNHTEKLALALGWICNNSSYKYFSPVFEANTTTEGREEIQLYMDAEVVKDLIQGNPEEIDSAELGLFFHEILPRALTRVHTLIPANDGHQWVNRITEWRRYNKNYLYRLADIITNPHSAKRNKYVVANNFYNPGDEIIRISRKLQNTEDVSSDEFLNSLDSGNQSLYASAVSESYRKILAAADYMEGEISAVEFENNLFN